MECPVCNWNADFECMTCWRSTIKECYNCEEVKECTKVEEVYLCDECLDKNYFKCDSCHQYIHDDNVWQTMHQDICIFCLD